jgi:TolB protein
MAAVHRPTLRSRSLMALSAVALTTLWTMPSAAQQDVGFEIRSGSGGSVVYAVPDFVAASPDLADLGKTLGQVLWDDLNFEREFRMLPRDVSATVPRIAPGAVPVFSSWKELGADALVAATVAKTGDDIQVEYRLYSVSSQRAVMSQAIKVSTRSSPRVLAHTISDAIFKQQRNLRGVARTKIAFVSDRNREPLVGTVEKREAKEIYMMDYDGANEQRLTVTRNLNINPSWAPDAKSIAYTSYSSGRADVVVSRFYEGLLQRPLKSPGNNYLPAISPDGTRIAFSSDRNGNTDIYVANIDGANLRRVTNNPAEDSVPTWSPSGEQIAFTSDRSGRPMVYAMNLDGTGVRLISNGGETEADRATWSPAPFNEIAMSAKHGSWYDIKIYDIATGRGTWLTDNSQSGGSNESPAFSPTGRHVAFMSTRTGSKQIWVVGRDGQGLRQLTRTGNNQTPTWSPN